MEASGIEGIGRLDRVKIVKHRHCLVKIAKHLAARGTDSEPGSVPQMALQTGLGAAVTSAQPFKSGPEQEADGDDDEWRAQSSRSGIFTSMHSLSFFLNVFSEETG